MPCESDGHNRHCIRRPRKGSPHNQVAHRWMRAAYFRDHRLSIHIRSTKTCIWRLQSLTDLCSSATRAAAWALRFTALHKGSSGSSLDIPAMIPAIASKRYGCHVWACAKLISLGLVAAGYGLIQGPSSLASETCALFAISQSRTT